MKAFLVINFCSGIGDTYSTLLSAYETSLYLESLGYDTTLVFETRRNPYFSHTVELDVLFNLSVFKNKPLYNISFDGNGNPDPSQFTPVQRLPQNQNSFYIFVSEVIPELTNYQSYIYGHTELYHFPRRPTCKTDLLSSEVIDIANSYEFDRTNVVGLHYRPLDTHGDVVDLFEPLKPGLAEFAKTFADKTILVSSNGSLIRNYMKDNYPNIFTVEFTHKNIIHFPAYRSSSDADEKHYIQHAQEITAEMYLYHYCQCIWSIAIFHSNFVTYGILNNLHHKVRNELMYR